MCNEPKECIGKGLVSIKKLETPVVPGKISHLKKCKECGQYFIVVTIYEPKLDVFMYPLPHNSEQLALEIIEYDFLDSLPGYCIRSGYGVVPI